MNKLRLSLAAAAIIPAELFAQAHPPAPVTAQKVPPTQVVVQRNTYPPDLVEHGKEAFQQYCAFCHGRDAEGGESGPDLTRSKLVAADAGGDQIGPVVRNGRLDKGMPRFNLSDAEIAQLVAFIHSQKTEAESRKGGRRGVDISDLQSGNAEAGSKYFNGPGNCASCHSAAGDLAGIAKRFEGLQLEERMLYPADAQAKVTVNTKDGQNVTGTLAYLDEFTVALRDETGKYRSWPVKRLTYKIDAPVQAHAELLGKYTDEDIHNLMAYLQTLR